MAVVSLDEWTSQRQTGTPVFAVGSLAHPVLYVDRDEAAAAANEADGTYIEWHGSTGHQVLTAEADDLEPEMEAGL